LHVGHASLIAGHIFRSYLANSWVWIFQPSSLRIGMDSSREHPKPNLLWVALLQGQPSYVRRALGTPLALRGRGSNAFLSTGSGIASKRDGLSSDIC
jgi:hypothetical protein